jgi:zinc/manganese transport system substrate-binding protein
MNRRNTLKTLLASLGLGTLSLHPAHAEDRLPVMASFSILGDLVQVVGGDHVQVSTLVDVDQDAHTFEPTPKDARRLLAAKVLVTNGFGLDHWIDKLSRSAGYKGPRVVASQGVKQQGHDPHAWQNPENVMRYVRNIATGLAQADPAHASIYSANAEAYVDTLRQLDQWAKEQLAAVPAEKRKVITSHDAFGYFATHYGVKFLAPQGMDTSSEPSAKQMGQLIRQIKQEHIRALFIENMNSPKLIEQLSREAGATQGPALYSDALSAADGPANTYLKMMRHNVKELVTGMLLN